jgi:hypothetical protein
MPISAFDKDSPAGAYLSKQLLTAEHQAEMEALYRDIPVEELWDWRQEVGKQWYETKERFPGLRPDENQANHPQEYRMQVIELQIQLMDRVLAEKGVRSAGLD